MSFFIEKYTPFKQIYFPRTVAETIPLQQRSIFTVFFLKCKQYRKLLRCMQQKFQELGLCTCLICERNKLYSSYLIIFITLDTPHCAHINYRISEKEPHSAKSLRHSVSNQKISWAYSYNNYYQSLFNWTNLPNRNLSLNLPINNLFTITIYIYIESMQSTTSLTTSIIISFVCTIVTLSLHLFFPVILPKIQHSPTHNYRKFQNNIFPLQFYSQYKYYFILESSTRLFPFLKQFPE